MRPFKRSLLSIRRMLPKNLLLFGLVFVLGLFLSFSFSIRQGVNQLEDNTIGRLNPVVTLGRAREDAERITFEIANNIAELPYVSSYTITSVMVFSSTQTNRLIPPLFDDLVNVRSNFGYDNLLEEIASFLDFNNRNGFNYSRRDARSFSGERPVEFEFEILELTVGQFPNKEEIETGTLVALVPRLFAEYNDLGIGDYLMLEDGLDNQLCSLGNQGMVCEEIDDGAAFQRYTHFEIIGLFDVNYENLPLITDFRIAEQVFNLYNDIYTTHNAAHHLSYEALSYHLLRWATLKERWALSDDALGILPDFEYPVSGMQVFLTLNDLRDWDLFEEAVEEFLLPYWVVESTRNTFLPVIDSLATMSSIADWILVATIIAAVIVLSLIIILIMRDRRYEVGIYLALGEKKRHILIQLLTELFIVTIVALGTAIFAGNIVSNQIASNLLETEIAYHIGEVRRVAARDPFSNPTQMVHGLEHFSSDPLSIDEIMKLYEVSMTMPMMIFILTIGGTIVLLSATIPIVATLKQNPKELLNLNKV